ncbi:MAG: NTP transferase domain-containing protein [Treponema sp.]|jgi:spore coat polysaccharide biosynthesis protein SpsF|nr:NTP transferase domain-containing protein [Treponema sp.]
MAGADIRAPGPVAVLLQARLDSSRLPGKALLPLGGRPLVYRVMEALARIPADLYILASPEDCAADFAPLAEEAGFRFCPGPKEDVLGRYCLAIRRFSIGRVIRATGDNPFVFSAAAGAVNGEALALGADYAAYSCLPYGAGVESVAAEALLRAERETSSLPPGRPEREHVCPYLYNHPELFLLHRPLARRSWRGPSIRITVDTGEDYERCRALWGALEENPGEETSRDEAVIAAWRKLAATGHPLFKEGG